MSITAGAGTNIIKVQVGAGYSGGTMNVSARNACGTSSVRAKTMLVNTPLTPSAISGPASGLCLMSGVAYSVPPQLFTQSYQWTLPAGTNLTSGQGSGNITIDFGAGFSSGNISVVAQNNCGNSASRNLSVKAAPAQAGPISGPQNICPGAINQLYSTNTVTGTTAYTWSSFSGVNILSGQGTKNITVNFPFVTTSGQSISVVASNSCGSAPARSLSGINLSPSNCIRIGSAENNGITVYPNPATGILNFGYTGTQPQRIEIFNILGEKIIDSPWRQSLDISSFSAGVYVVRVSGADVIGIHRVEVVR
jgi:hypothetical protein